MFQAVLKKLSDEPRQRLLKDRFGEPFITQCTLADRQVSPKMLNLTPISSKNPNRARGSFMVVAAIIFSVFIFSISLFLLFDYIRSQNSMQENRDLWARQQELQLKREADLRARIEADTRRLEEARRALLERARGDSDRDDAEHAA
jgi:hypothetical protein